MPELAAPLVEWYGHNARDLPWRREGFGAWGTLVSEFMLQQTPVARVIPHLEAWLDRWPTPGALAAEAPAEAVRQWANLGYPRRALWLHRAATETLLGLNVGPGRISLTPRLPAHWPSFEMDLRLEGHEIRLRWERAVEGEPAGESLADRTLAEGEWLMLADLPARASVLVLGPAQPVLRNPAAMPLMEM